VVVASVGACSSYPPTDAALDALVSDDLVTVTEARDFVLFEPVQPTFEAGLVFYPGGLVQHEAYAEILRRHAEAGVVVALVPMPSDLAVFAPKKADKVFEAMPGQWMVGGHSLGGAMAATYAVGDPKAVAGVALWAAYPAGNKDLSGSGLPVLSITATEDEVLYAELYEERKALLPGDTRYVSIEGGNHAGVGSYGPQDGDGEASLPRAEQHAAVVAAMVDWMTAAVE